MHHAANLWNTGDDLLSTFWVITTGPSCVLKGRRECQEKKRERGESQSYRGKERVVKKEETECMKLDSKLYKASREEKGKRQKDGEKRRFYRVRLGIVKGTLVKEE